MFAALFLAAAATATQPEPPPLPQTRPVVPLPHYPAVIQRGPTIELLRAMKADPEAFEVVMALDALTDALDANGFSDTKVVIGSASGPAVDRLARARRVLQTWKEAHKVP